MGRRLLFDLETDTLLRHITYAKDGTKRYDADSVSQVWSMEALDLDTGEFLAFSNNPAARDACPVADGIKLLSEASLLVGHNILTYDCEVIRKLWPTWSFSGEIHDTLVLSRLIWPEIKTQLDFSLVRQGKARSGPWLGRHSLEAWGVRLNRPKDDYSKRMKEKGINPWGQWSQEMQDYCRQDVITNAALYEKIVARMPDPRAIKLEHEFAFIIHKQEEAGIWFNTKEAEKLYASLAARRDELDRTLKSRFNNWYVPEKWKTPTEGCEFIPKKDLKRYGYTAGAACTKIKLMEFNPGSREQIALVIKKLYGWEPTEFTETGLVTINDDILAVMPWPEAKLLSEYLTAAKIISMMAEGKNAWLKLEERGRIYGSVNTNGAVTGRCTHSHPNIAQVPKVGSPFGKECRGLFGPPPGWTMLGADAAGLELRMLAHFMAAFDKGAYGKIILEGDIHSVNSAALFGVSLDQFLAGRKDTRLLIECANEHPGSGRYLQSLAPGQRKTALVKDHYGNMRNDSKTFIYAFLYGAGAVKLGSIVVPLGSEKEQAQQGSSMMNGFMNKTPAIKKLRQKVKDTCKAQGFLKGIDGRKLHIRSDHSALNALLQSAGALVVKRATVIFHEKMALAGYVYGRDWLQLAHIHDEFQLGLAPGVDTEAVGSLAVTAIREAGEYFNFRLPLDGEFKSGLNWAETH